MRREGRGPRIAPQSFMTPNIGHFQFTHPFAWPHARVAPLIGLCLLFGVVLAATCAFSAS